MRERDATMNQLTTRYDATITREDGRTDRQLPQVARPPRLSDGGQSAESEPSFIEAIELIKLLRTWECLSE